MPVSRARTGGDAVRPHTPKSLRLEMFELLVIGAVVMLLLR